MLRRGETVTLSISTQDAHLGVASNLLDSNGAIRLLASNERLILTDVVVEASTYPVILYLGSTLTTYPALAFGSTNQSWHTDGEGMSLPRYTYPWLTAPAGGLILGGTGYIIQDGGFTSVPPFRANVSAGY